MAKPNPFGGKKATPFGAGKGSKPNPFAKKGKPDPDAAQDAMGFKRGGKAKRK